MENQQHELRLAMEEFVAIQKEQAALLQAGRLKTLSGWVDRRQQVFIRLKQCLEQYDPQSVTADSAMARMVQEGMEAILLGEKTLATQAECRRSSVKKKLGTMRKGKTVLNKYSSSPGAGCSSPKFLSSRM